MKKNFFIISISLSLFCLIFVNKAYGQSVSLSALDQARNTYDTRMQRKADLQMKKTERETQNMARYKAKADQEIDRRVSSLQTIITKISSAKHFTESQKSTFTSQIQTEIANLTSLKAKIDADTDMTTLRTDVQSVIKSYRVYALYIPKIHSLGAVNEVLNAADKMSEFIPKLQAKITEAQTAGKDVAALNLSLSDMQNKIADARTKAQNAQNVLTSLAPEGYPGNKTSFESAKATLQTARQDLKTAREDGSAILNGLRAFGPGKAVRAPSTSPSISPATSPAPSVIQ